MDKSQKPNTPSTDYLDLIKNIPILDICRQLGIEWTKKGDRYWCKLRGERTASTLLHPEMQPNKYVDFGNGSRLSDVIQLVSDYKNMSRSDAIKWLAETFNIVPLRQTQPSQDLAVWEYEKIGLHGDLATKNFSFDIERQGFDKVAELSQKYSMPMNELRREHPKIYEQLLWDRAVPFVRNLRNDYYLSLMNLHQILKLTDFSQHPGLRQSLMKDIDQLQTAERLLQKAALKTNLKAHSVGSYDPDRDLQKVLSGELKPSFGNRSFKEMEAAAEEKKCELWRRTIALEKFKSSRALDMYPHFAFFEGPNIIIRYLQSDYKKLKPIFDKMAGKENLAEKIADAESRQQNTGHYDSKKILHEPDR